jgi:hypothetical protein
MKKDHIECEKFILYKYNKMEKNMAKRAPVDYRRIIQDHFNYTDAQMHGMDVHHINGNRNNNDPSNLILLTPEEHAKIHKNDFVKWSRKGSKLGNEAFIKRLREHGPTEKELAHRNRMVEIRKKGLHRVPHSEETKKIISDKKKHQFQDKTKHPMWGNTTYEVESPSGEKFIVSGGWKDWCNQRNLNSSNLRSVALGKRKNHKGWKAKVVK